MDEDNLAVTRRVVGSARADRVHLALAPTGGGSVPDPYYGGADGFADVFRMLDRAMARWVERIA